MFVRKNVGGAWPDEASGWNEKMIKRCLENFGAPKSYPVMVEAEYIPPDDNDEEYGMSWGSWKFGKSVQTTRIADF